MVIKWHNMTLRYWHWFINDSAWAAAANIKGHPSISKLIILQLISSLLVNLTWQFIPPCLLLGLIELFIPNSILLLNSHLSSYYWTAFLLVWEYNCSGQIQQSKQSIKLIEIYFFTKMSKKEPVFSAAL